jgi:voltage-gated potassium channel
MNDKFKSFRLFFKAMGNTKHEMWVTVQVLIAITVVLAIVLWIVESSAQSEFNFWGSLTWPFMQYIEDPGGFADYQPSTFIGRIIAVLVGIIGIAIFAVPAGLIGSGFMDAIAEDKREEELAGFRRRMQKAFRRSSNKGLREYLNTLPDGGGDAFKTLNIVPQRVPVAKMQVRQGMDMKDIIDTCNKFEEFRLKNLADAHSTEDYAEDRFMVEHFPLNRKYGCCIPRNSKVTIVCTSSL